ncbi:glycosyltransferase [Vibrio sp. 299]|uniref:glycosyltransferase family 8 protein n=1 Tax=Vibrio TaxID=662 RepID=UPI0029643C46|nr:glycosyltransferase [Vibrio sp. 299]MDW1996612.1 glycosyltransferase [Vibrio sp. 299]
MIVACFCADLNYKPLLEVAFLSFAKNNSGAKVYVLKYDDFCEETLNDISQAYNIDLNVNTLLEEALPSKGRFSKAMYGRFHLYDLIEEKKFVYLDCDIIVNSSLTELFDINIHQDQIGLVKDIESPILNKIKENLDIDDYYNSGMILFNKSDEVAFKIKKVIEYLKDNADSLEYPDQDAINVIFAKFIYTLPYKFNYMNVSRNEIKPIIVHYAHHKPWDYLPINYYNYLYFDIIDNNKFNIKPFIKEFSLSKKFSILLKLLLKEIGVFNFIQKVYWNYVK